MPCPSLLTFKTKQKNSFIFDVLKPQLNLSLWPDISFKNFEHTNGHDFIKFFFWHSCEKPREIITKSLEQCFQPVCRDTLT